MPSSFDQRSAVLIIEPDGDVARILEVRLASEGYDVLRAETADAGRQLAEQQPVDVVLLDRNAPDVSALALVRDLRVTLAPCEIIVTTVDPTVEIFVEALDAGAFDLLVKPFSHLTLVAAKVRHAADKVRAVREVKRLQSRLNALTAPGSEGSDAPSTTFVDRIPYRLLEEAARALRYDRPLALALLRVDRLESIVEQDGAEAADRLLASLTQVVSEQIRDVDILEPLTGGLLMLMLPETSKADAAVVAERLRAEVERTPFVSPPELGVSTPLTASVGIAALPADAVSAERLREAAQAALGRAAKVTNTVALFESSPERGRRWAVDSGDSRVFDDHRRPRPPQCRLRHRVGIDPFHAVVSPLEGFERRPRPESVHDRPKEGQVGHVVSGAL